MKDVIVVGAGLAGLACAREAQRRGAEVLVLEAADGVGGRVRTDEVEGFRLDRGFQVLLTAYPECRRELDYTGLRLKAFKPGALVRHGGKMHRLADPFRTPIEALEGAFDPLVSFGDKLRVGKLRMRAGAKTSEQIFAEEEMSTAMKLRELGFSAEMVERFFRPFYGGVFLETELVTSSRLFEFYFKMFAEGETAVPARGMGEIAKQMAADLRRGGLRLGAKVMEVVPAGECVMCRLEDGEELVARQAVLATNDRLRTEVESEGRVLMPGSNAGERWNSTVCFYFASEKAPLEEAILVLNGEGDAAGPVNNFVVMSAVSAELAPEGQQLMCASVVGRYAAEEMGRLETGVREQLGSWFGAGVKGWRLLKSYNIPFALPRTEHVSWEGGTRSTHSDNVFVCGDLHEFGSLQGALMSGRRAAEAALGS